MQFLEANDRMGHVIVCIFAVTAIVVTAIYLWTIWRDRGKWF